MARWTGKCGTCKAVASVEVTIETTPNKAKMITLPNGASERVYYSDSLGHHAGATCLCGRRITFIKVRGRVTEHKCGAKCLASKGFVCDCSCGGKNHGAGFAG